MMWLNLTFITTPQKTHSYFLFFHITKPIFWQPTNANAVNVLSIEKGKLYTNPHSDSDARTYFLKGYLSHFETFHFFVLKKMYIKFV